MSKNVCYQGPTPNSTDDGLLKISIFTLFPAQKTIYGCGTDKTDYSSLKHGTRVCREAPATGGLTIWPLVYHLVLELIKDFGNQELEGHMTQLDNTDIRYVLWLFYVEEVVDPSASGDSTPVATAVAHESGHRRGLDQAMLGL
ncbi:hypothetical protein RF11_05464 [Thelohanellus kitauei]|uniref:Uncharacterized protein n=1 Tax=Thelohanellus kitauei TaxID=669202 RepID=A0A0C2MUT2_THEKT|nr:hypothetical protein RF11_05464 [Thelohanellus kitauei]